MTTASQRARALGFGSVEEEMVFNELVRRGLQHGDDFTFQNRFFGGRLDKGGIILDFLFYNPPGLAINVQGVYYHYEQGVDQKAQDQIARIQIAAEGIDLIFIDDDDVHRDVRYYVDEALHFRDHSRITRGII